MRTAGTPLDAATDTDGLEIRPFDAALGADVRCGDLRTLGAAARRRLRDAWLEHLVLRFRGQRLDDEALVEVSTIFGASAVANVMPKDGLHPRIAIVSNVVDGGRPIGVLGAGELLWHSDHSFNEAPLAAAMLHAIEVPETGGDTHFCNMYAALHAMPEAMRRRVESLTIKNDGSHNSAGERRTDEVVTDLRTYRGVSHPIVRTHPDTGLNVLYLGRRPNAYVDGLAVDESERLLDALWAHATQPRFTWVQRWRTGDLVVWDNRCTMHRRDAFDPATRRIMHRAQTEGDRPSRLPGAERDRPHPRAAGYAGAHGAVPDGAR